MILNRLLPVNRVYILRFYVRRSCRSIFDIKYHFIIRNYQKSYQHRSSVINNIPRLWTSDIWNLKISKNITISATFNLSERFILVDLRRKAKQKKFKVKKMNTNYLKLPRKSSFGHRIDAKRDLYSHFIIANTSTLKITRFILISRMKGHSVPRCMIIRISMHVSCSISGYDQSLSCRRSVDKSTRPSHGDNRKISVN